MQFRDLQAQYNALKIEIDEAIQGVISQSSFISGNQVHELEEQLASYVGMKHCVTCANGTDALSLALMVWDIGPGNAVFVPDFTFFATGEVVSYCGATPVFVDVDPDTYNMDPKKLEAAVKRVDEEGKLRPAVVIAVDLFGLPADYDAIRKVTDTYSLKLLEDGAQGFGGRFGTRMNCSFGDIGTTSFFPAKPLGCYGDGGAIFTNSDEEAALLRSLCVHGKGSYKYDNVRIGVNSRLDTLQAAILQVKFKAFKEYELDDIEVAANRYTIGLKNHVKTPMIPEGYRSGWAQYTIQLKDEKTRDGLQTRLKDAGIPSMVYYPKPMHEQLAFAPYEEKDDLSVTKQLCKTVLSLPLHPYLTSDGVKTVIRLIIDGTL